MRYYEFPKADYYALIAVAEDDEQPSEKALRLYVEQVGYGSLEELKNDGITAEEVNPVIALVKYAKMCAEVDKELSPEDIVNNFDGCSDVVVLIDGALI